MYRVGLGDYPLIGRGQAGKEFPVCALMISQSMAQ
jgi:hypothetical protein